MKRIRVLIVDDSSLARALLRSFLEGEPDIEIAGEACNGREAVDLARELRPDLVTMDLEMPVMDGMAAIEEIMSTKAVPILVVSSVADAHHACEAVRSGALDAVGKPECTPEQAAEFVAKVRLLAGVAVITHMRPRNGAPATPAAPPPPPAPRVPTPRFGLPYPRIFAIASSTGGPQALAQVLPQLPADFPCPVMIAQHIADGFAGGMADWLGELCRLPVRIAEDGELIQLGTIYISPSERHLAVTPQRRAALIERRAPDIYRPSCDALLESVAAVYRRDAVGIILTGMGSDGARGMASIRAGGGVTLGQDEASSVIYGMNKVAIDAGAVATVLPVAAIAAEMRRLAGLPVVGAAP